MRHKYSPHTCRHTFATLMKRVAGADKDKQELIGHASAEMLRYYQDVNIEDLRRITDAIWFQALLDCFNVFGGVNGGVRCGATVSLLACNLRMLQVNCK